MVPSVWWWGLVALLGFQAQASDGGIRCPTFEAAVDDADVIVWGQVIHAQHQADWVLATLQVEHVAKGEAPPTLMLRAKGEYINEDAGLVSTGASIGSYGLYFLRRPQSAAAPWEVTFGGQGFLDGFMKEGRARLASAAVLPNVQLPPAWCEGRDGGTTCSVDLARALRTIGLPVGKLGSRRARVYRVGDTTCEPCDFETLPELATDGGVVECRSELRGRWDPAAARCVGLALKRAKPFHFRWPLQGIDSAIEWRFVSDGKRFWLYQSDSSVTGGGDCAASVSRRACKRIVIDPDAGDREEWVRCEPASEREWLCSQDTHLTESLGPPNPIRDLHCQSIDHKKCRAGGEPKRSDEVDLPLEGPDMVCHQSYGRLFCETP